MAGLRGRNEKAAIAHLLLAGLLAIFALLMLFRLSSDLVSGDRYAPAILIGVLLFLVLPAAVNGLIAWGARRKALWAKIASIIVAVLSIIFACSLLVDMGSYPLGAGIGPTIIIVGVSSAFLAFGVYLLLNSRWR